MDLDGGAPFLPGGPHHQSIPNKLVQRVSEDSPPRAHPSPSLRYEVKEQDEEQVAETPIPTEDPQQEVRLVGGDISEIPGTKLSAFVFQLLDAGVSRGEIIYEVDNYMRSEEERVNKLLEQLRRSIAKK